MSPGAPSSPTNLVNLESVTAHVPADPSRVLLDGVSLGIADGDRIGVVGRGSSPRRPPKAGSRAASISSLRSA